MQNFKLQRIDESIITQHSYLSLNDICFFFGEYAIKKGYQHSPMNQLIFNLKKEMGKKGYSDWIHKEQAIEQIAHLLTATPNWKKLEACTWVPFPPSKRKTHQEYDDRLTKILEKTKKSSEKLDIREMLTAKTDRQPSHPHGKRLTEEEHICNLSFDESLFEPKPEKAIVLFDDVITSGASFKAAKKILQEKFPFLPIAGIFIARAV